MTSGFYLLDGVLKTSFLLLTTFREAWCKTKEIKINVLPSFQTNTDNPRLSCF